MSYDNRFQSKESSSSHYPGEEHYYASEKIKPQPPFYRRYVWQILVCALAVLVILLTFAIVRLLIRQPEKTVSPQPPVTHPKLAVQYNGTVQNNTCNCSATLTLTSIVQNQQVISGKVVIGSGLCGTGPFTGTIRSDGSINFTDIPTDGCANIIFSGSLHADGSLGGTYTVPSWNQDGLWQASPS